MKTSFVIPLYRESQRIGTAVDDLSSFFRRWPLEIEFLFVVEAGEDPRTLAILEEKTASLALEPTAQNPGRLHFSILRNDKKRGRGPSLQKGLDAATGDVLGVLTADLSIPLGEVLTALQEFIREPTETAFVIGNRRSLKRPRHGSRSGLKRFFDEVEYDKARNLDVPDPTCPFWLIRRELWLQISPRLRFRQWYYTPALLQEVRVLKAPLKSLEVVSHDSADTRFRWWPSLWGR